MMVRKMEKDHIKSTLKGIKGISLRFHANEMIVYVFYDIEEDKIRSRVANACKDYGLERIQFSGFLGTLSRNKREEFHLRLARTLGKKAGRILMQPVCEKDFKESQEIINIEEENNAAEGD
jgi:CRISPR-associated protein Cas2